MPDPIRSAAARYRRAPAAVFAALQLLLPAALPPAGRPVRAQELPSEVYPEPSDFRMPGQDSDYYQRTSVQDQLLLNINRYHLSEENFWSKYRQHHLVEARGDLMFALKYFPNHPTALYLMEQVGKEMGQPDYAVQYYERALQLFPQHPYTRAQYGAYLVRLGARGAGIMELRSALAADSTLIQARAWLEQAENAPQGPAPPKRAAGPGAAGTRSKPGSAAR